MSDESATPPSCVFFKAPVRRGNAAVSSKRRQDPSSNSSSSSSDGDSQPSAASFRSSSTIKKGLVTTSKGSASNKRRERKNDSDDEQPISGVQSANSHDKNMDIKFKSDRTAQSEGPRDMGATATVDIDTDLQHDQQAIFERAKKINEEMKGKADDKIYRGMNNYQQFYEKKDTALGNASSGLVRNKGE